MISTGQVLNDTYEIGERLGSGGGGIIYKAYHRRMRKIVAIKLIKDDIKGELSNRTEVDVLKNLKHEYLPQVLDFAMDGDDIYTVMEFVEGQNFKQLITSGRTFTEKQVKKYALQLCEAVKYLHNHVPPIIHSDIKPANIMLTPQDNICLIDFNISMMSESGIAVSKGGSRDFAAPEQFRRVIKAPYEVDEFHEETRFIGDEETEILTDKSESRSVKTKNVAKAYIDTRTDIYGIGSTVYYILTSRVPVGGRTDFRGVHCSAAIKDAVKKAMDPDPSKRFKNVSELESALKMPVSVKKTVLPVVVAAAVIALCFGIIQMSLFLKNNYVSTDEITAEETTLPVIHTYTNTVTYEQAIVEFEKKIALTTTPTTTTTVTATETISVTAAETTPFTTTVPETTTVTTVTTTKPTVSTTSSNTEKISTAITSSITEYRGWNETEINETLYIKSSCYSRKEAIVGADSVKKYEVGQKITVVAATDTGFYKLKDGTYIHSDYVTDQSPVETSETTTTKKEVQIITTPPISITEETTIEETSKTLVLNIDILPVGWVVDISDTQFDDNTTWSDYYWLSSDTNIIEFIPNTSTFVTKSTGECVITSVLKSDPDISYFNVIKVVDEDTYNSLVLYY